MIQEKSAIIQSENTETEDNTMSKTLIAFFSRADENYFGGAMRYVKVGNTKICQTAA